MKDCPDFDYINWTCPEAILNHKGKKLTFGLFQETTRPAQYKKFCPVYTLQENSIWIAEPWNVWIPSAKQIYVRSTSEYEAAIKLVGSIEYWNRLLYHDWFVEGNDDYRWTSLNQWREEQRMRKQHLAENILLQKAMNGDTQAAKMFYQGLDKNKRGRPSDSEIKKAAAEAVAEKDSYSEDHARVVSIAKNK